MKSVKSVVEVFAFMEAADESKRHGGKPVKISEVLKKAEVNRSSTTDFADNADGKRSGSRKSMKSL